MKKVSRKAIAAVVGAAYLFLGLAVAMLTGCASSVGSGSLDGVTVAQRDAVKGCTFVGDVYGTSPMYGVFAAPALAASRDAAMRKVAELGGTHVVWKEAGSQYGGTEAAGDAFRCAE